MSFTPVNDELIIMYFSFTALFSPLTKIIANLHGHLDNSRQKKNCNLRMSLYGSFHSSTEGRYQERRREVYTLRKKLININGQEGSCREQRKARKKKREKTKPDRQTQFIIIVSWCSIYWCKRDVITAVLVNKQKNSDRQRILIDIFQ